MQIMVVIHTQIFTVHRKSRGMTVSMISIARTRWRETLDAVLSETFFTRIFLPLLAPFAIHESFTIFNSYSITVPLSINNKIFRSNQFQIKCNSVHYELFLVLRLNYKITSTRDSFSSVYLFVPFGMRNTTKWLSFYVVWLIARTSHNKNITAIPDRIRYGSSFLSVVVYIFSHIVVMLGWHINTFHKDTQLRI